MYKVVIEEAEIFIRELSANEHRSSIQPDRCLVIILVIYTAFYF
uniref:Uncharacterized protein n=1 Tax=Arundo donax TaxID=35708 RepID=A0A0A9H039_ARUDO